MALLLASAVALSASGIPAELTIGGDATQVQLGPAPEALSGVATWHATGRDGNYAAAGPLLRTGLWRGSTVIVLLVIPQEPLPTFDYVRVVLNDWCACGDRNGKPTLLDLSDEAFDSISGLGEGVIDVVVLR